MTLSTLDRLIYVLMTLTGDLFGCLLLTKALLVLFLLVCLHLSLR